MSQQFVSLIQGRKSRLSLKNRPDIRCLYVEHRMFPSERGGVCAGHRRSDRPDQADDRDRRTATWRPLAPRAGPGRASRPVPELIARGGQGARADPGPGGPARRRDVCDQSRPVAADGDDGLRPGPASGRVGAGVLRGTTDPRAGRGRPGRAADGGRGHRRAAQATRRAWPGTVGGGPARAMWSSTGWSRSAAATGRSPRSSTACASPPTGPGSGAA